MRPMMSFSFALLCCAAVLPTASAQTYRGNSMVRTSSKVAPASYHSLRGAPMMGAHGGGCGCDSPAYGCAEPCNTCNPCCPCLLPRLIHGVGRVLDCLFTCRGCGGGCGVGDSCCGGCAGPGLLSGRHGGCAGCAGCAGGHDWSPMDSSDPFMDDMPHSSVKPPVPPKDASYLRSRVSPQAAGPQRSKARVVGPIHVSPPRTLDSRSSASVKPLTKEPQRVASRPRQQDSSVVKTSGISERKSTRSNPLRDE